MQWTDERILQLIKQYQDHDVLWNSRNSLYKHSSSKVAAWQEISAVMNIDPVELKRKIASLLASYRRERLKVKTRRNAAGVDKGIESTWFAYKNFSFLQGVSRTNTVKQGGVGQVNDGADTIVMKSELESMIVEPDFSTESSSGGADSRSASTSVVLKKCGAAQPVHSAKETSVDKHRTQAGSRVPGLSTSSGRRDHLDAYGEYIAGVLRQLDPHSCAFVQKAFGDILFEALTGKYSAVRQEQYAPSNAQAQEFA